MNRAIEVTGSYGVLTVDATDGSVVDYDPNSAGDDYKNIARVNLTEWSTRYEASPVGPLDILDLGYWTDDGHYEPPDEKWRALMADIQAEDERYRSQIEDAMDEAAKLALCGPMGRVI